MAGPKINKSMIPLIVKENLWSQFSLLKLSQLKTSKSAQQDLILKI